MLALEKQPNDALTAELIRHAAASINAADHFSRPFPHIFFRDFFPDDFYRELIGKVPTNGYVPIKSDGSRMSLPFHGEHMEKVDPALRDIWAAVSNMLTSAELEQAVRSRLRDGLEIRARGDKVSGADALRLLPRPVLYRDRNGYQIKPHPDTRKKVVTMQLYCPADNSQEELGTTLYRASLKGLTCVGSYFLEPVKTLPFLPNVGYAFVVLKAYHAPLGMSWHGRPQITTPIEQPRLSILNTYYAR